MVTFHLTDGTAIDVRTYGRVATHSVIEREGGKPIYTVFTADGGHQYLGVAAVAQIDAHAARRQTSWYDLPIAAGMWAADGSDLKA